MRCDASQMWFTAVMDLDVISLSEICTWTDSTDVPMQFSTHFSTLTFCEMHFSQREIISLKFPCTVWMTRQRGNTNRVDCLKWREREKFLISWFRNYHTPFPSPTPSPSTTPSSMPTIPPMPRPPPLSSNPELPSYCSGLETPKCTLRDLKIVYDFPVRATTKWHKSNTAIHKTVIIASTHIFPTNSEYETNEFEIANWNFMIFHILLA